MCSYIKTKCYADDIYRVIPTLIDILTVKGGDEYNFIVKFGNFTMRINYFDIINVAAKKIGINDNCELNNISDAVLDLINIKIKNIQGRNKLDIIGFSRLTPEMEDSSNALSQPYHNTKDDTIIVVHGTIPKAEEIAARNNIKIEVDTDLFNFLPFDYVCRQTEKNGGKISAFMINSEGNHFSYHNGLGLYDIEYKNEDIYFKIITNIDVRNHNFFNTKWIKSYDVPYNPGPYRVISLYSGGLDISCATQRVLHDLQESGDMVNTVDLWYFDWDTVAKEEEIKAGKLAEMHLEDAFNLAVKHRVIEVQDMFKNILGACDMRSTRLSDPDASGAGSHEAEAAISYVPYRNTFLITLAAAKAEQLYPNENCLFVIGANLSEGMVYLDNSETWTTQINHLIKVGGQQCMHFELAVPYVNRTKTEMIKDAINKGFYIKDSFSCYFPVDGKPCGKCGSCLLRENAITRGEEI